jgi:hypothetical protein
VRSIEQFRKGVDEFLRGVENFNRTMENLNETTERINSLLTEVEQPIRAAIPQVTRTVKTADEMMQVVSGPAMAVAPGLNRLAETLATPAFAQLPNQIGAFSDVLAEVSRRLGPLTQIAESAGGLFGGFRLPGSRIRPLRQATLRRRTACGNDTVTAGHDGQGDGPGGRRARRRTSSEEVRGQASRDEKKSTAKKSAAKKSTAKKSTAKKSAARSPPPRSRRRRSRPHATAERQRPTKGVAATRPIEVLAAHVDGDRGSLRGVRRHETERDPVPSTGEKLPLVTCRRRPVDRHRATGTRWPSAVGDDSDQSTVMPRRVRRGPRHVR